MDKAPGRNPGNSGSYPARSTKLRRNDGTHDSTGSRKARDDFHFSDPFRHRILHRGRGRSFHREGEAMSGPRIHSRAKYTGVVKWS